MFTDTHAHLSYPDFAADLAEVVARAEVAGVERIVSIATDLESARRTLEIAGQFAGVYAAVGLHPGEVPRCRREQMQELAVLASAPKVVAIGETGLDYYREAGTDPGLQRQQQDLFRAHLELAKGQSLPVVIHNRSADGDLLGILREHAAGLPTSGRPWGVMHCFAGNERFAADCFDLGLLISFTGILGFKNATALRELAAKVPLEGVMLETDAPYLAPPPHRGQRNEPARVPLIAAVLAGVKGVDVAEVARITSRNAQRLFRFPPAGDLSPRP